LSNSIFIPPHRCKHGSLLLKKEGKFGFKNYFVLSKFKMEYERFSSSIEEEYAAKLWEVVRRTSCYKLIMPNKIGHNEAMTEK